jgi:hypothetical protein
MVSVAMLCSCWIHGLWGQCGAMTVVVAPDCRSFAQSAGSAPEGVLQ